MTAMAGTMGIDKERRGRQRSDWEEGIMGMKRMRLVDRLIFERDRHIDHALFYWTQIQLSYNSNHMEGSTLTPAQTAQIYETGRFLADKQGEQLNIDDAIETANHFDAFNFMLDHADEPVDKELVCRCDCPSRCGSRADGAGVRRVREPE